MPRDVRKMCEPCNGTGVLVTAAGLFVVNQFGTPRRCIYCHGTGVRVFEEFTQREFDERFKGKMGSGRR